MAIHNNYVQEYIAKIAPRIMFAASKESTNDEGDYEGNSNELVISEALAPRVFNDTQDPAGNSRDDISDERFTAVKLYIQIHFLSTIIRKLAYAITQEFFGPNFVTPKLGSFMGGEVGTDIEMNVLGMVVVLEWPKDVSLRDGQSDEDRLWAVTIETHWKTG